MTRQESGPSLGVPGHNLWSGGLTDSCPRAPSRATPSRGPAERPAACLPSASQLFPKLPRRTRASDSSRSSVLAPPAPRASPARGLRDPRRGAGPGGPALSRPPFCLHFMQMFPVVLIVTKFPFTAAEMSLRCSPPICSCSRSPPRGLLQAAAEARLSHDLFLGGRGAWLDLTSARSSDFPGTAHTCSPAGALGFFGGGENIVSRLLPPQPCSGPWSGEAWELLQAAGGFSRALGTHRAWHHCRPLASREGHRLCFFLPLCFFVCLGRFAVPVAELRGDIPRGVFTHWLNPEASLARVGPGAGTGRTPWRARAESGSRQETRGARGSQPGSSEAVTARAGSGARPDTGPGRPRAAAPRGPRRLFLPMPAVSRAEAGPGLHSGRSVTFRETSRRRGLL